MIPGRALMTQLYFDYNASTPVAPQARQAMLEFLSETRNFGNPSRGHWAGLESRAGLDHAREQVAAMLGAEAGEIIFTSGGSESNNHAIKGIVLDYWQRHGRAPHIVTSVFEHPATLQPLAFLEHLQSVRVSRVPVNSGGTLQMDKLRDAITADTALISIMHANNEVGTRQPVAEIAELARADNIPFHVDAVCSAGKIPVDVKTLGCDLLSISGHKLYAPKGIGALFVAGDLAARTRALIKPLVHGAGQQGGMRSGTESVPLAVALGAACELITEDYLKREGDRQAGLTESLWQGLTAIKGQPVVRNGHGAPAWRLPNTLNVSFPGIDASQFFAALPDLAVTTGGDCSSVVALMGGNESEARGSVRFSLGRLTSAEDVRQAVGKVKTALAAQSKNVAGLK